MAFLDNSGDIILDAVLTDVGRKRMAAGDFRITKFTLGDDEIDYSLYNLNHPSGNAYFDLEILQTPVLEAFTQQNAAINYGLVSFTRQDLLYIPSAVINEKTFNPRIASRSTSKNVFFLADNTKVNASGTPTSKVMTSTDNVPEANILISADTSGRFIMIETGIQSQDAGLSTDSTNQATYISSVGLMDSGFMVRYDNRFIQTTMGAGAGSQFANGTQTGASLQVSLTRAGNARRSTSLKNYNEATIGAAVTRVYKNSAGSEVDDSTQYSAIVGPRGAFTALNFMIRGSLTQTDYVKFGTVSNDLFGSGQLYDFIDTTVYVQGLASNANIQLPIRIIKLAQT